MLHDIITNESFPLPKHDTWTVLDPSKMQTFLSCPRQFFWQYVAGWRPEVPSNHLVFGSAMHKALEHLYHNNLRDDAVLSAYELFLQHYRPLFPEDTDQLYWPKTPSTLMEMLFTYVHRYKTDALDFEILSTEMSGTVPIDESRVLHFRMDSIMRNRLTQRIFSLEHKSGSSTWNWEIQWPLKIATGCYTHCMYCLYGMDSVDGVLINGLFFKKNKTNPFDLMRVPAYRTPAQMQAWLWTTVDLFFRIEEEFLRFSECSEDDAVMEAFPMNCESCSKYTGCPYHDFCTAWSNPLPRLHTPQPGFIVEYWDPRADESPNHVALEWKGAK